MTVQDLLFNKNINLQTTSKEDCIFKLSFKAELSNHLNAFHAAAIFALAEASSAQFLLNNFSEFKNQFVPLLRSTKTKYKLPAFTDIYGKAILKNDSIESITSSLNEKKRALVTIEVTVINEFDKTIFAGEFEWFLTQNNI